MDVDEVLLPGVGVRYDLTLPEGDRLSVVARRHGDFVLVAYDRRDPDRVRVALRLVGEAAEALAQILGAPRITQRFADLSKETPAWSRRASRCRPAVPTSTARWVRPGPVPAPVPRWWPS